MPVLSVNWGSAINILYLLLLKGIRHSDHLTRGERRGVDSGLWTHAGYQKQ